MSLAAMVLADRSPRLIRFYDRWLATITFGRDRAVRRAVLRHVGPGETLLDVGCGTGTLAIMAARAGARVVAIDRSRAMLELARRKAAEADVEVEFRRGDATFPPIGRRRFDVVTATFVLGELSADMAEIVTRRLAAAARPGGLVVIADETPPTDPILRMLAAVPRALLALGSFFVFQQLRPSRRHPWRSLLTEAGLMIEDESRPGAGSLVMLVARRPPRLRPVRRPIVSLDEVLPTGARRWLLRSAAWLTLPIAVAPGVYAIGRPGPSAPVLLTGNFLGSVEAVRAAMGERDGYLVVEDSDGWNVWCASDAGRFNAEKAAAMVELHRLGESVDRRVIVVPRLGGRVRSPLEELTGWQVQIGPLEARDLPSYLELDRITPDMRSLARMYGGGERLRVAALTLLQLPLFLLPFRLAGPAEARAAWRFGVLAACALPALHDALPGRTGVVKATALGAAAATAMVVSRPSRLRAAITIVTAAPLIGWVYQSSSPVVFWKRLWR
jgi:2-polyprenyl-3-methyl-5-hydroxy-6-metoxy-1,4-benzoquinol methylase